MATRSLCFTFVQRRRLIILLLYIVLTNALVIDVANQRNLSEKVRSKKKVHVALKFI